MNLAETGIIAICRKIYGEDLMFLAKALYQGGIRFIEVTSTSRTRIILP